MQKRGEEPCGLELGAVVCRELDCESSSSEGEQRHPMLVSTSRIQFLTSKYHSPLKGSQLLGEMAGSVPGAGHV